MPEEQGALIADPLRRRGQHLEFTQLLPSASFGPYERNCVRERKTAMSKTHPPGS